MNEREMLQDLERAHHNVGAVMLRIAIPHLLEPNIVKCEEQVADAMDSLVRTQEKMRRLRRRKERRL